MAAPYEVIGAPYEIYLAAVGSAFPKVDATPTTPWTLLGTSGFLSYDNAGVTVEHNQTVTPWTPAGSTGPRKAFRTAESLKITVKVADLSPTMYAKLINNATVTVTAAGPTQAGESYFSLQRGNIVSTFALLCKGLSPAGDSFFAQYEVPQVYDEGSPKVTFMKGTPSLLECSFTALTDDTLGFGVIRIQTAAHS